MPVHIFAFGEPKMMKIREIMKFIFSEAFWLSGHRFEGSERCANGQCSNNLQRRGLSLSSNTPSREGGREGREQFRVEIGRKLNPGGQFYHSFRF